MTDWTLRVYHCLPPFARSLAASLYGPYLRSWRYGPETKRLVEEALEREHWSPKRWKTWQEERLGYILHCTATRVPYYRKQWAERRRQGDRASWEYLENWPILEKKPLRENPNAFVADDCNIRHMYHDHTAGTTGTPLNFWFSRETVRAWFALFEARVRCWNGVSRYDRWAVLGGQLVTPVTQRKPPFWVWNAALSQLYMSSYHLTPDLVPHYMNALMRYKIRYMYAYPSSLYVLAQKVLEAGRKDLNMSVAITFAEPLFDHQRQAIAEAFHCPVRETYGMSEMVAMANQCQAGQLHLWPEIGWLEVVEGPHVVANGTIGDLVCTGLLNADMPLIRYRVGDRSALPADDEACTCGRRLPMLALLEGRTEDVLYTVDGRHIGRLDPVFKADLPVCEAQIIQEALNRVRVRYVPTRDFSPEAGRSIIERLQARMGAVEVILEPVDEVPRGANGKFRAVICNLPPE
jgi:phenylacetate-CoA ligase